MKLEQYYELIGNMVKRGYGKMNVVAAIDDEGNGYRDVFYGPSVFKVDDIAPVYRGNAKGNVVCIN